MSFPYNKNNQHSAGFVGDSSLDLSLLSLWLLLGVFTINKDPQDRSATASCGSSNQVLPVTPMDGSYLSQKHDY